MRSYIKKTEMSAKELADYESALGVLSSDRALKNVINTIIDLASTRLIRHAKTLEDVAFNRGIINGLENLEIMLQPEKAILTVEGEPAE